MSASPPLAPRQSVGHQRRLARRGRAPRHRAPRELRGVLYAARAERAPRLRARHAGARARPHHPPRRRARLGQPRVVRARPRRPARARARRAREAAIARGFHDRELLEHDDDLRSLRDTPRYREAPRTVARTGASQSMTTRHRYAVLVVVAVLYGPRHAGGADAPHPLPLPRASSTPSPTSAAAPTARCGSRAAPTRTRRTHARMQRARHARRTRRASLRPPPARYRARGEPLGLSLARARPHTLTAPRTRRARAAGLGDDAVEEGCVAHERGCAARRRRRMTFPLLCGRAPRPHLPRGRRRSHHRGARAPGERRGCAAPRSTKVTRCWSSTSVDVAYAWSRATSRSTATRSW